MAVARKRITSAAGLDQNIRPNNSGFDMHRRDFRDADADLVFAEPRAFVAHDGLIVHFDDGGKKRIPARPAARRKFFWFHESKVNQPAKSSNWNFVEHP